VTIYFTSDTHFGDPRVLRIDHRPFPALADHDAALVARWNEVVGDDDVVWHLGDVAGPSRAAEVGAILAALKGEKHLVIGNNDGEATIRAAGWASVQHYAELTSEGHRLVLCHYPFRTWNGMGKGAIDLHGHSHGRLGPVPRQYDVGVDAQDFRPVTLSQVLASRRGRRQGALATDGR
jgi:calcineurin-like phosphoesterase family protein